MTDWDINKFWGVESIRNLIKEPKPKLKYIITNDRDDFIVMIERIAENAFEATKDNLRYLEQKEQIKQIKDGVDIHEVFPWLKDCTGL